MRVIAGELKGRRFEGPPGEGTRPTSDKVREALFAILFDRVEGARILDGFAGSGALSFEALSRGAAHCTLVERDRRALAQIKKNIDHLRVTDVTCVMGGDFLQICSRLYEPFDIIFFDPPYHAGLLDDALAAVVNHNLLAPGGLVICEFARREGPVLTPPGLCATDERRYGSTYLRFYQKEAAHE